MPGCTGLDVAASLGRPRPAIIFCTAFDQHAVDAFELQAVDYLLKPVNRARLDASLARSPRARRASGDARCRRRPRCPARRPRFLARRGARLHGRAAGRRRRLQLRRRPDAPAHGHRAAVDAADAGPAAAPASTRRGSSRCRARLSCTSTPCARPSPTATAPGRSCSRTARRGGLAPALAAAARRARALSALRRGVTRLCRHRACSNARRSPPLSCSPQRRRRPSRAWGRPPTPPRPSPQLPDPRSDFAGPIRDSVLARIADGVYEITDVFLKLRARRRRQLPTAEVLTRRQARSHAVVRDGKMAP